MVTQPLLPRHGLDEPLEDQPGIKDAIDQRREHAVDLAHARHEPALLAGAFLGVAVEAPACAPTCLPDDPPLARDRKSTRLNSSHRCISYAVFCLKKKTITGCST